MVPGPLQSNILDPRTQKTIFLVPGFQKSIFWVLQLLQIDVLRPWTSKNLYFLSQDLCKLIFQIPGPKRQFFGPRVTKINILGPPTFKNQCFGPRLLKINILHPWTSTTQYFRSRTSRHKSIYSVRRPLIMDILGRRTSKI